MIEAQQLDQTRITKQSLQLEITEHFKKYFEQGKNQLEFQRNIKNTIIKGIDHKTLMNHEVTDFIKQYFKDFRVVPDYPQPLKATDINEILKHYDDFTSQKHSFFTRLNDYPRLDLFKHLARKIEFDDFYSASSSFQPSQYIEITDHFIKNNPLSIKQLDLLCSRIRTGDSRYQLSRFLVSYIKYNKIDDQDLKYMVESNLLKYQINDVFKILDQKIAQDPNFDYLNFLNQIYDNPALDEYKLGALDKILKSVNYRFKHSEPSFENINNFLNKIENIDALNKFLSGFSCEPIAWLMIMRGKFSQKFELINKAFLSINFEDQEHENQALGGSSKISQCLNHQSLDIISRTSNGQLLDQEFMDQHQLSILDVFNFILLARANNLKLYQILKPEFLEKLQDKFIENIHHDTSTLFVVGRDFDKMLQNLGIYDAKLTTIEGKYTKGENLTDYFQEKLTTIPQLQRKEYQIFFSDDSEYSPEDRAQLNNLFNKLLKEPNLNQMDISQFFCLLWQKSGDEATLIDSKKDVLKDFFRINKANLAFILSNQDFGAKTLHEGLMATLNDGCFANIGTQLNRIIYSCLLKGEDIGTQIVFQILSDHIAQKINATNNGENIDHSSNDLFATFIVKSSVIPIEGLLRAMTDQIPGIEATKIVTNWYESIGGSSEELYSQDCMMSDSKSYHKLASYITLAKILPNNQIDKLDSATLQEIRIMVRELTKSQLITPKEEEQETTPSPSQIQAPSADNIGTLKNCCSIQ